jgi:hypothetical protein
MNLSFFFVMEINMKNIFVSFVFLMLLTTSNAWSEEAMNKPSLIVIQGGTLTAIVDAINHETREVTLRSRDGKTVSFVVSEEAHNLDQVSVGDYVVTSFNETIHIQVHSSEDAKAEVSAAAAVARAEKGDKPGMAATEQLVMTAIVEDINIEANTFKLKGPQGDIDEYTARNPENLKKAQVGDLVTMTYTKSVALTVEKAEAPE